MISLLAFRNLLHRPWRSALLFAGYGLGVGVMVVLLSIGEALIAQASREQLVGGGQVTVLPEGVDVEVLKTGGLGGLYFSIPNARFVQLQLLAAPRLAPDVAVVAPQIDGKLLYLRTPARAGRPGRELPVRAAGEIPSATRAVGGLPAIDGTWADDDGDRRWAAPSLFELRHAIDHFHLPPANLANRASYAEWHYFNVLSDDGARWAFITLMVAGDVGAADSAGRPRWGGQVLVTAHASGQPGRRYSARVPPRRTGPARPRPWTSWSRPRRARTSRARRSRAVTSARATRSRGSALRRQARSAPRAGDGGRTGARRSAGRRAARRATTTTTGARGRA